MRAVCISEAFAGEDTESLGLFQAEQLHRLLPERQTKITWLLPGVNRKAGA